ncbi:GlcG/HbpS family heme-binding protein [Vibrio salinus]|uniref:GlcG/HbpS family heme-binding protein n=1 Tax=Vibrio salinus TaxID=2899784 RepID=UPI0027E3B266|nr:heme-binding protein [Vibrio salinus]
MNNLEQCIERAIAHYSSSGSFSLSLNDAIVIGRIAADKANEMGVPIVFSLVDASGNQRYFYSMDDALLVSRKLAFQKAWTAAALKMATHELAPLVQPGSSLYGLQNTADICCFGGGLPCWSHGRLLGAIGISGGTVEQDMAIACDTLFCFSQSYYLVTSSRL